MSRIVHPEQVVATCCFCRTPILAGEMVLKQAGTGKRSCRACAQTRLKTTIFQCVDQARQIARMG